MYLQIGIILAVMVLTYTIAKWRKLSVELSMLSSAIAGGLAGAFVHTPPITQLARHLVEGSFTYLDVILVFTTATIFMAIISESGGVNYVVRGTIKIFFNKRVIALLLLMIIVLIPGALTGAGSVSLLVVGAPIAMALGYLGISKKRVAAILFIVAGLSAAAPPVNIWAMILCAGTAIPYVGFEFPLGIPVLILGTFTMLTLGWKREGTMKILAPIIIGFFLFSFTLISSDERPRVREFGIEIGILKSGKLNTITSAMALARYAGLTVISLMRSASLT